MISEEPLNDPRTGPASFVFFFCFSFESETDLMQNIFTTLCTVWVTLCHKETVEISWRNEDSFRNVTDRQPLTVWEELFHRVPSAWETVRPRRLHEETSIVNVHSLIFSPSNGAHVDLLFKPIARPVDLFKLDLTS